MHLTVDFWIERSRGLDEVLADEKRIAELRRDALKNDERLVDLAAFPDELPASAVSDRIRAISTPPSETLFYPDGNEISDDDYSRYAKNLNLDELSDPVSIRFGMVLRRAAMRTWPTLDTAIRTTETQDLDRFQENGLFPADTLAILHESRDGQWYFAQSYNYAAWVRKDMVVIGDREGIFRFRDASDFIIVAGNKVTTNYNPEEPALSELQLDMGVRLPLLRDDAIKGHIGGQHPQSSHAVSLPVRGDGDRLAFRTALIARNQDVSIGYMPYTRRNILHQAFKFLGERYGWGHAYNARDCSGLVMEVFKTFGIPLPRNAGQQRDSEIGHNRRISPDCSASQKLAMLAEADVGDLLYSPGHVMLYLGEVDGEPWAIHSLFGAGWIDEDGAFQEGVLNGVTATPIRQVYASASATYFDELQSIKQIR